MDTTQLKIREATENAKHWIEVLATKSDSELERRLGINELLYQHAFKNKQADVCELMELMRRIIIEARIYKEENNIATVPNEMELAIAESNRSYVKAEERQEIMEAVQIPQKNHKPKIKDDNQDQISLF
ncbi:MAG: hypothetical protein H0W61_07590 [Bacteroidetes bacterium]|nr:hypothetical protein [Bacteroidota bacterium]